MKYALIMLALLGIAAHAAESCEKAVEERLTKRYTNRAESLVELQALERSEVMAKVDQISNEITSYERFGLQGFVDEGRYEFYMATVKTRRQGEYDELFIVNPDSCVITKRYAVYWEKNY